MSSLPVAKDLQSTVTLNDGVAMPLFGLGCYLSEPGSPTEDAVTYAIQHGYRLIDTAQFYKNEADVGRGVKKSGVKREDIFVVTKVLTDNHGYELTTSSVLDSLAKSEVLPGCFYHALQRGYKHAEPSIEGSASTLGLTYIDQVLIHSPFGAKNVDTYRALLDLKAKGIIRSVGVSNFGIQHLEGLKSAGLPAPSVNQVELHPFYRLTPLVEYCRKNGIAVMGYSPIAQAKKFDDPDLIRISKRLNKSIAQVMIRWGVQNGYITIPKSTKPQRIVENAQVFDFSLTAEDLKVLNSKPEGYVCAWNPTVSPWEG